MSRAKAPEGSIEKSRKVGNKSVNEKPMEVWTQGTDKVTKNGVRVSKQLESFFYTGSVKEDGPGEGPSVSTIHCFRGSAGKKAIGLKVVKTCGVITELVIEKIVLDKRLDGRREEVREKVKKNREWRKVDCFICRAGDGRKLRIEAGPSQSVRLPAHP